MPVVELRKLAHRGGLSRIGRGLYRFDDVPATPQDQYTEAVLWAGRDAVLAADAVLALHLLAQANPTTLRVYTPHRPGYARPHMLHAPKDSSPLLSGTLSPTSCSSPDTASPKKSMLLYSV